MDMEAMATRLREAIEREGLSVSSLKLSPYDNGGLHVEIDGDACLTNIGLWPNGCMDVEYVLVASQEVSFDHRLLASTKPRSTCSCRRSGMQDDAGSGQRETGVGRALMEALRDRYRSFHQLMLTSDGGTIEFYEALGFARAGKTVPMWIHAGDDH